MTQQSISATCFGIILVFLYAGTHPNVNIAFVDLQTYNEVLQITSQLMHCECTAQYGLQLILRLIWQSIPGCTFQFT